jgi:predicted nucleotide-binding protein
MRLTELGQRAAKNKGAQLALVLKDVMRRIAPYSAVVERAVHRGDFTVSAVEVASNWHEHFKPYVSDSERVINDQAVCFFQIAQGADLGEIVVGRKGQPTRFEFSAPAAQEFAGSAPPVTEVEDNNDAQDDDEMPASKRVSAFSAASRVNRVVLSAINRVFITHGKNRKVLEQIKEIVAFGNFEAVVAEERESVAKPVPEKVMDEMRSCQAAVIHVSAEGTAINAKGVEYPRINENVLIEIGAAMALYGRNFILLVEDGLTLPSNLQGLYECRYTGDELNTSATMKLLKAFNDFREKEAA